MKRLTITIIFFAIQLLIGLLVFYDTLLLLLVTLSPAVISFVYLQIVLTRQKESIDRSNKKSHTPFIFFGLMIVSQLSIPLVLIFYYSQPAGWIIYTIITSSAFTLSSLMTIFFIPLIFSREFSQEKIKMKRSAKAYALMQPVSIIVPAYNEERHIRSILNSLLEVDYQNKEVIVVDDGSTDKTYSIASVYKRYFPNGRFSVIRKQNGGKSSALNYGIRFAKGDIIVVIDADSIVERDTIKEVLREFQDSRVIGVAGDCIVSNRVNFLSKCQALEYIISINVFRRAFGVLGLVLIVPGPLGAFRRKAIIERGLCDQDTSTEDFDVTLKLLKTGGIVSEIASKSYTRVPTTFKDLYTQKTRWNQGAFQTLLKHKDIMSSAKHGLIRIFLYPIKLLSLLVLPLFDVVLIGFTVQALLTDSFIFPIIWFALFIYFYSLLAIVAIASQKQKDWKLLLYMPFMSLVYRQFIDIIIIKSLFEVLIQKYQNRSVNNRKNWLLH
jgi:cellulose synthase/poly-beta-1,6-N-acetylglucosamine synthase-like glycosyltransferase